jgi:hypothetical protein
LIKFLSCFSTVSAGLSARSFEREKVFNPGFLDIASRRDFNPSFNPSFNLPTGFSDL